MTYDIQTQFAQQADKLAQQHDQFVKDPEPERKVIPDYIHLDRLNYPLPIWRPKRDAQHVIDVLPFFAGKESPTFGHVQPPPEGTIIYNMDFWTHDRIGPLDNNFICTTKTWGVKDPVCGFITNYNNTHGKLPPNEWANVKPTRRNAFLVWVHTTPEERAKGLQLWIVSFFYFLKNMSTISSSVPGFGSAVTFYDFRNGKAVAFQINRRGDNTPDEHIGHQLLDRNYEIPQEIIQQLNQIGPLDVIFDFHPDEAHQTQLLSTNPIQQPQQIMAPTSEGTPLPVSTTPGMFDASISNTPMPMNLENPAGMVAPMSMPSPAGSPPAPSVAPAPLDMTAPSGGMGDPALPTPPAAPPNMGGGDPSGGGAGPLPPATINNPNTGGGTCPFGHIFGQQYGQTPNCTTACVVLDNCNAEHQLQPKPPVLPTPPPSPAGGVGPGPSPNNITPEIPVFDGVNPTPQPSPAPLPVNPAPVPPASAPLPLNPTPPPPNGAPPANPPVAGTNPSLPVGRAPIT
jgi:hypothetical protein